MNSQRGRMDERPNGPSGLSCRIRFSFSFSLFLLSLHFIFMVFQMLREMNNEHTEESTVKKKANEIKTIRRINEHVDSIRLITATHMCVTLTLLKTEKRTRRIMLFDALRNCGERARHQHTMASVQPLSMKRYTIDRDRPRIRFRSYEQ